MRTSTFGLVLGSMVFILAISNAQSSGNIRTKEVQILDELFNPEVYDSRIRPNGNKTDSPVTIKVNTYVRSMKINDAQEFESQLTFRMQWRDDRLAYREFGKKYLTLTSSDQIWIPDVFFSNEIDAKFHNIILPNILIRIYPDGEILYSRRLSLRLSCPMDLTQYPLDEQTCPLRIASYGYTTDDVQLIWKESDPVQVTKNLNLPNFSLQDFETNYCTSKTTTGEYSCINIDFNLERESSYYFASYYIPTIQLVVIAYIASWLNHRRVTARVIVGLLALLSITALAKSASPAVSYTTAIDTWFTYNSFFILIALLETVVVQLGVSKHEEIVENSKPGALEKLTSRISTKAHSLDVVSRILFPIIYGLYNIYYWSSVY